MSARILTFVLILLILSTAVFAAETTSDTTMVLGGPDRWDGRFETSEGLPDWHGWTHADLYENPGPSFWNASDHLPVDGQYSAWCGTWFDNGCEDGYGNDWAENLQFTYQAADPALPTTVHWQASVTVDSEGGYDFLKFRVGQGYYWDVVGPALDGFQTIDLDLTITIEPEDYIDGAWRISFYGTSDGAWSDEDCLVHTQGLARVDNIVITADGIVVNTEDFEDGTLGAWVPAGVDGVGDYTALWENLNDIDPEPAQENSSWQVAFIDDGVVVPRTGGTACYDWCYGPDGWVFNIDAGSLPGGGGPDQPIGPYHGGVWNGLISPPMDWPFEADAGEIAFDVYAHMQSYSCGATTYGWSFRTTDNASADALENELWLPTRWSLFADEEMPWGPGYFRVSMPMTELPPNTQWAQVRLEAYEFGPICWGEYVTQGTPAPYFDNIAVKAWSQVSGTPDVTLGLYLSAQPNPFNPRVALSWSQPTAGPAELSIFDMRGHLMRTLVTGDQPAGPSVVHWDGQDNFGQNLATGIYLVSLRTTAGNESRKISLVR
jgi:hypothetical protein